MKFGCIRQKIFYILTDYRIIPLLTRALPENKRTQYSNQSQAVLKQIINQDEAAENADQQEAEDSPTSNDTNPLTPRRSGSSRLMGSGKNILSSDVEIKGKLRFSNDLIIDGRIEGEVNSEGDLTVGENAQILGDIKTRSAVIFGKVNGDITVTDRCELKQNAELQGDVVAGKLAIEEGASFMGLSTVGAPTKLGGTNNDSGGDESKPEEENHD